MGFAVQFYGSSEWISAPDDLSEEQAASWACDLFHPGANRVMRRIGSRGVWSGSNGRRGMSHRGAVLTVRPVQS